VHDFGNNYNGECSTIPTDCVPRKYHNNFQSEYPITYMFKPKFHKLNFLNFFNL